MNAGSQDSPRGWLWSRGGGNSESQLFQEGSQKPTPSLHSACFPRAQEIIIFIRAVSEGVSECSMLRVFVRPMRESMPP